MSGQLALVIDAETVVAAAVWETLPARAPRGGDAAPGAAAGADGGGRAR